VPGQRISVGFSRCGFRTGAKATLSQGQVPARLKSCPDTIRSRSSTFRGARAHWIQLGEPTRRHTFRAHKGSRKQVLRFSRLESKQVDRIGRYRIVKELGRGAMGVVYHAVDPNIGRPVAIKTIRIADIPSAEERNKLRERLFREARSAGMLSHPGIVTIYDVEQQGDLAYIAMEYVDGFTLDHLLSQEQPFPQERMFSVLRQTAVALDYAHQKGIVHRDIKPANIMVTADGTVKIADFGIAKVTTAEHFTMTGAIVGTPHYMSPEQVQGQAVDGRSDQFSLAVITFEMLTGEKPFTGEHLTTVVYKIVAEEPLPPHRLNATLSGAIENCLRKALSKDPAGRYRTCQEFTVALEKACAASKGWKTMPRSGGLSLPTMTTESKPSVELPQPRRARRLAGTTTVTTAPVERRKTNFLTFLLAVLVAAGLIALIGWQAAPFLSPSSPGTAETQPAKPPEKKVQPPESTATSTPAPAPPQPETKPSPMPPPASESAQASPPHPESPPASQQTPAPLPPSAEPPPSTRPATRAAAALQPVTIVSSPAGATATLDGKAEMECATPCSINVPPGRHTLSVVKPGYEIEHRQVDVGNSSLELSPIIMRSLAGTLLLTTVPPGANVLVNGKRIPQTTPAQIALAPGPYTITVEKDGKQSSKDVDIKDRAINYLKIPLDEQ
jgi:serine/threonine protein kinase